MLGGCRGAHTQVMKGATTVAVFIAALCWATVVEKLRAALDWIKATVTVSVCWRGNYDPADF